MNENNYYCIGIILSFNDLLIVLEVLKRESGYQQNRLQGQD